MHFDAFVRRARGALLIVTAALLAGCGAMTAQNPGGAYSPVNAVAVGGEPRVMLGGADVVAYFNEGRYRAGEPRFASRFGDIGFHFASAGNKAAFDADPARYLPQYGGYCANGIAYGIPWGGDADTWKLIDGKLYIFGGAASKAAFELDEKANLALAEKYWREEIAGHHSFVRRAWRLVVRVPHYRSGEELARAVADAKAKPAP